MLIQYVLIFSNYKFNYNQNSKITYNNVLCTELIFFVKMKKLVFKKKIQTIKPVLEVDFDVCVDNNLGKYDVTRL